MLNSGSQGGRATAGVPQPSNLLLINSGLRLPKSTADGLASTVISWSWARLSYWAFVQEAEFQYGTGCHPRLVSAVC